MASKPTKDPLTIARGEARANLTRWGRAERRNERLEERVEVLEAALDEITRVAAAAKQMQVRS